jgi:hypothetical protein
MMLSIKEYYDNKDLNDSELLKLQEEMNQLISQYIGKPLSNKHISSSPLLPSYSDQEEQYEDEADMDEMENEYGADMRSRSYLNIYMITSIISSLDKHQNYNSRIQSLEKALTFKIEGVERYREIQIELSELRELTDDDRRMQTFGTYIPRCDIIRYTSDNDIVSINFRYDMNLMSDELKLMCEKMDIFVNRNCIENMRGCHLLYDLISVDMSLLREDLVHDDTKICMSFKNSHQMDKFIKDNEKNKSISFINVMKLNYTLVKFDLDYFMGG